MLEELVGSRRASSLSLQAAAVLVRRKASCCITLQKNQQLPRGEGCPHPPQSSPSPRSLHRSSPQHKESFITQNIRSCICRTATIVPSATGLLHSMGYQHCGGSSKLCCRAGGPQATGSGSCSPEDGLCFPSQKGRSWRGVFGSSHSSWGGADGRFGRGSGPQQGWAVRRVRSPTLVAHLGSRTGCFLLEKQN